MGSLGRWDVPRLRRRPGKQRRREAQRESGGLIACGEYGRWVDRLPLIAPNQTADSTK